MNVYINNNVFESGQSDRTNSKSVWLTWKETLELRDAINSIEDQLLCMEVRLFIFLLLKIIPRLICPPTPETYLKSSCFYFYCCPKDFIYIFVSFTLPDIL